MPTRLASTSTSAMSCDTSRMTRPCRARARMRHTVRRLEGSSPVVTSSASTMRLSPTNAMASDRRRRMPPDRLPACRPAYLARPTAASAVATWCATSLAATPFTRA